MPRVGSNSSITRSPPASQRAIVTFCWLPPGQAAHLARRPGVDRQPGDRLVDAAAFLGGPDRAPLGDAVEQWEGDVLADRALRQQGVQAVGGHEHDAAADDVERVPGTHRPTVDDELAAVGLAVAGEDLEQRLLALAFEGGEAEHLARGDGEADVVELAAVADAAGFEHRALTDRRRRRPHPRLVADADGAVAEHRLDDRRFAALAGHERGDVATVTQHGAHVAVLAHLGEAVRDEQHRAVALAPPAHHGEHSLGQVRRQGGGDLVEEQQLRVERQGAGEVEHAQERQRHVAHLLAEVEAVEVHLGEVPAHGADVGAGEAQVLGDGEIADHRRVLEHRGESAATGVAGTAQGGRLAVDADRAGVGAQHAGEDLDERRLAGAVGAEQGVDLAGGDRRGRRRARRRPCRTSWRRRPSAAVEWSRRSVIPRQHRLRQPDDPL